MLILTIKKSSSSNSLISTSSQSINQGINENKPNKNNFRNLKNTNYIKRNHNSYTKGDVGSINKNNKNNSNITITEQYNKNVFFFFFLPLKIYI